MSTIPGADVSGCFSEVLVFVSSSLDTPGRCVVVDSKGVGGLSGKVSASFGGALVLNLVSPSSMVVALLKPMGRSGPFCCVTLGSDAVIVLSSVVLSG